MINELKSLRENKKLCAIYKNWEDPDKFAVGYVLSEDDTFFAMHSINPSGEDDGVLCCKIEHVLKIETESKYLKNIETLMNKKEKEHNVFNSKVLYSILSFSIHNKRICCIRLCNDNLSYGFINKINDEKIYINVVDDNGEYDGNATIRIEDVDHVEMGTKELTNLEQLFSKNIKLKQQ